MSEPSNPGQSTKRIRVFIVDDSSVIRNMYSKIFSSDPELEVVGTAPDPYVAREHIVKLRPDVMTLDIEMPRMDGLSFLEAVMKHFPIRTLVISSLSTRNSQLALRALEVGAIEVMAKPAIDVSKSLQSISQDLIRAVKNVARASLQAKRPAAVGSVDGHRTLGSVGGGASTIATASANATAALTANAMTSLSQTTHQILAIASSTGGTEALKEVLPYLPPDLPGTLIVQHMPPVFTKVFAEALAKRCPFEVREASDGDRVLPGLVLLAPGNFHMELTRSGAYYYVKLHQQPQLHGVRPAADYLMTSVAKYAGSNAIGVVLTGMGKDGAKGLKDMKDTGATTIAQDEKSCVVFGMPKEAIAVGGVEKVLPLDQIAGELIRQFKRRAVA
jgi:two-component system chemotaxis response regulator CheB